MNANIRYKILGYLLLLVIVVTALYFHETGSYTANAKRAAAVLAFQFAAFAFVWVKRYRINGRRFTWF